MSARILSQLEAGPKLRLPILVEETGASRRTARRAIDALQNDKVPFEGAPRNGTYRLGPDPR